MRGDIVNRRFLLLTVVALLMVVIAGISFLNSAVVQAIANVLSVIVASVALYVAINAEQRNQKRFDAQLRHSRELTQASIKPFLDIYSQTYTNLKSVRLVNRGLGPAVITKVEFSRHGEGNTNKLVDLFRKTDTLMSQFHINGLIDDPLKWDTLRPLYPERVVSPNETIDLVKLSAKRLQEQKLPGEKVRSLLEQW